MDFIVDEIENEMGLLWWKASNTYGLFPMDVIHLMTLYINNDEKKFNLLCDSLKLASCKVRNEINVLIEDLSSRNNFFNEESLLQDSLINTDSNSRFYSIYNKPIAVQYQNSWLESLIHWQIQYFLCPKDELSNNNIVHFYIFQTQSHIVIKQGDTIKYKVESNKPHVLQGRFFFLLLSVTHNIPSHKWLATFHASTISNGTKSIMCVGRSGSGKSTINLLLMHHGYTVLADDFSPMRSDNNKIYAHPAGLSIKNGSFRWLDILYANQPNHFQTKKTNKGMVKIIPLKSHTQKTKPIATFCNEVVLINYDATCNKTHFKEAPKSKVLEVLIEDSWIANSEKRAFQFIKWVKETKFYELTYSSSDDAFEVFDKLFDS